MGAADPKRKPQTTDWILLKNTRWELALRFGTANANRNHKPQSFRYAVGTSKLQDLDQMI